jgi:hypothetical protein
MDACVYKLYVHCIEPYHFCASLRFFRVCAAAKKQTQKPKRQAKTLLATRTGLLFSFTFVCLPSLYECHWPNTAFKKKAYLTTKPFDSAFFLVEAFILVVFVV